MQRSFASLLGAWALLIATTAAQAEPVVLAAASTNRALSAALEQSGIEAVASYAASGILARQIEQGAPADLFVSANPKWMMHLVDRGLVDADRIAVLMSNRLVLIAPRAGPNLADLPLEERLDGEVFAMADPTSAPVGAYGRAALEHLGMWSDLAPSLVPMRNTLVTVAAVATGDAALGLVYASDARGQDVQVLWEIPEAAHPAIQYLIAPIAQGQDAAAAADLLAYLDSAPGRAVLKDNGFVVEPGP